MQEISPSDDPDADFLASFTAHRPPKKAKRKQNSQDKKLTAALQSAEERTKHLVDVYTCPIAHELPEDPVIAEVS